jgi:hypothetical protein
MVELSNKKGQYFKRLSEGQLSYTTVNKIATLIGKHLTLSEVPPECLQKSSSQPIIGRELSRLSLHVANGHKSWAGLVVGFPGTAEDLSTTHVGTPYLRMILYPILDLFQRLQKQSPGQLRCIYFVGERFSDVFLRKFRLLNSITPHVIVLTGDLLKTKMTCSDLSTHSKFNEAWVQCWLSQKLRSEQGLSIPVGKGESITAGFLANELLASEGTKNPERLDILAYDRKDKTLITFELKGPDCSRSEFENLLLQGVEHRNWLEANKMAVKFFFDGTSTGKINSKKRVRLIIGFFNDYIPPIFKTLRQVALEKDKHLKIDFIQISGTPNTGLSLTCLDPD